MSFYGKPRRCRTQCWPLRTKNLPRQMGQPMIPRKQKRRSYSCRISHSKLSKHVRRFWVANVCSSCMRRLQGNLAYLAHLADNKKAASGQAAPAHPSYMKPPPLSPKVRIRAAPPTEGAEGKAVEPGNRDDTIRYFNDLYTKLQHLYPGVDYNKEPALPPPGARPGPQGPNAHKQMPSQSNISVASPVPGKQATPKMAASGPPQMPPQMPQQMPQQMPLGQPTMNGPAA